MALLKKINDNWQPSEKPGLQVGEIFDFPGAYENLVKTGMAILVDENGTELPLPTKLECPICFNVVIGLYEFVDHVSTHSPKAKEEAKVKEAAAQAIVDKMIKEADKLVEESDPALAAKVKKFKDMTDEEKAEWRRANLAKARAKKKNGK